MKKSLAIILTALSLVCLLSGCVQSELGVRLNSNGTGSVSVRLGIEQSAYEQLKAAGTDPFAGKSIITYTEDGVTYAAYIDETEYGTYEEIEEALLALEYGGDRIFKSVNIEKNGGIFYSAYTFKATLNAQKSDAGDINDLCKVTVTVTMPADVSQIKGGTAEGDTAVFEIKDLTAENSLAATAEANNIGVVIGIIAVLVVVAAVVFFLVKRQK